MDTQRLERAVREILEAVGEDPSREGLLETPARVARMYQEIFSGLEADPKDFLKIFDEGPGHDELVLVKDIPLYSVCEHHLLPFIGRAHIAYIPKNGRIIGLSKFARIVDCFARRPQVQERLTGQIADFLFEQLEPLGVAVFIQAEHLCMTMRGARAAGARPAGLHALRRQDPGRSHGAAGRQVREATNRIGGIPMKFAPQELWTRYGGRLLLREAQGTDAGAVLAYLNRVGGESDNLLFGKDGFPLPVEREAAFLERQRQEARSILVLGFAGEELVCVASCDALTARERVAHRASVSLTVARDYWGQGIGRGVMEALIAFARQAGLEVLQLEVRADNTRAVALYEHLGFEKLGLYRNFMKVNGQGFDAWYMNLYL